MTFFNAIGSTIKTGWNAAKKGVKKIGETIKTGTVATGKFIHKTIKGVPHALGEANRYVWNRVAEVGDGVGRTVGGVQKGALSGIGSAISSNPLLLVGMGVVAFAAVKAL